MCQYTLSARYSSCTHVKSPECANERRTQNGHAIFDGYTDDYGSYARRHHILLLTMGEPRARPSAQKPKLRSFNAPSIHTTESGACIQITNSSACQNPAITFPQFRTARDCGRFARRMARVHTGGTDIGKTTVQSTNEIGWYGKHTSARMMPLP